MRAPEVVAHIHPVQVYNLVFKDRTNGAVVLQYLLCVCVCGALFSAVHIVCSAYNAVHVDRKHLKIL